MFDRIPSYFHSNISLFVLIIIGIIAGLIAYFQYRRTVPPISRFLQVFLGILRASAIGAILLLFFAPEITAIWQISERGELGILIDRSASMGLKEGTESRLDRALAAVEEILDRTGDQVKTILYAFDMDTIHLNSLTIDTTNLGTNIEKSINSIINSPNNIKDLIVLTDGNYTAGNNPIYSKNLNEIKVFTVGIGDTVDLPDLLVQDVKNNQIIYQNQPTEIKAYLMARGIDNQKVRVKLLEGKKVLQAKEIQMGKRGEMSIAEFQLTPKNTGLIQYRIEIQALLKEAVVKNNSYTISLNVLKGKVTVGLMSAGPGNENKFLQFILSNLNEIELKSSIYKKNNQYFLNRPEKIMDSLDVLILDNYPSFERRNSGFDNAIKKAVTSKIPTLLLVNKIPAGPAFKLLQSVFPIRSMKKNRSAIEIQPRPSITEKSLPLLSIFDSEDDANKFWNKIPPIIYKIGNVEFGPSVKILLENPGLSDKEDQGLPVIAVYEGRDRKSILMLGSGFWRWHFLLSEDQFYHDSWLTMIKNMIRWLDSKVSNKNVIISSPKKSYEVGENILLTTQVYDGAFNPVGDALIRTKITNPSSTFEIESEIVHAGNYEGNFIPMTAGKFEVETQAWRNDVKLGEDKIELVAIPVNQEFRDIKQNVLLLNQLAAMTGGTFIQVDQAKDLVNQLNFNVEIKTKEETMELWNRWPMLVLIIILLGTEWIIRKRKGLA